MTHKEIEQIANFVQDTAEALVECEGDVAGLQVELGQLQKVIEQLTQAIVETTDPGKKALLTSLNQTARRCKNCVLQRWGGGN